MRHIHKLLLTALVVLLSFQLFGSDMGEFLSVKPVSYKMWLQYSPLDPGLQKDYSDIVKSIYCPGQSPILQNAKNVLQEAACQMTGTQIPVEKSINHDGIILLGTIGELNNKVSEIVASCVDSLKDEGYLIKSILLKGNKVTVITSKSEKGVLYGVFHFLRLMQTEKPIVSLEIVEEPLVDLRMLNHWDGLDGSIERGYAGKSLWKWDELPDKVNSRIRDYARFCASIGINGAVLNNLNTDSRILRADYLEKVKALADELRRWGIQTYLSVNFASPIAPSGASDKQKLKEGIGNLKTADPLNPKVQEWWRDKADEIYKLIPDFGGFLIKADSEGTPGPSEYNRNHADGANMLAEALEPHGGVLLWRTFVYGKSDDRAKDVYNEFKHLDGKFDSNVILQIKNGPLDFQPCEPFTPLFGAMPNTHQALELQITKEYLGYATTLAFLAPMWKEVLESDTYAHGKGSTVAKVIDGSLQKSGITCIAGVANTGDNENWCGSDFNQANWYAFGRLAWDHQLSSEDIADEWIQMTFHCDPYTHQTIKNIMLGSYNAFLDYAMPLGLNFLHSYGHYDPKPENRYTYHHADTSGLGVDRTSEGSDFTSQYYPEVKAVFNDINTIPLDYLLYFHHVPWDYKLRTGRSLWKELNFRYNRGVQTVDRMLETWNSLETKVDETRFKAVQAKLTEETKYARTWRKSCLEYFGQFVK